MFWVRTPQRVTAERGAVISVELVAPARSPAPPGRSALPACSSDLFGMGRYAERAEGRPGCSRSTRERYHEFRYRPDLEESQCVPVLLAALGSDHRAPIPATRDDDHEMIAIASAALWSANLRTGTGRARSRNRSSASRWPRGRCVTRCPTTPGWCWPGSNARLLRPSAALPESPTPPTSISPTQHSQTLAGMLALSGVAAESMVQDIGWTMMDLGKRIERGLALTALLRATLTKIRASAEAERAVTESALVACESSVIYRRRNPGQINIAAIAELVLFDAENPRSLIYQLEQIRIRSRRPCRIVGLVAVRNVWSTNWPPRLRRLDPAGPEEVTGEGTCAELAALLDGMHAACVDPSVVITAAHLSCPAACNRWGDRTNDGWCRRPEPGTSLLRDPYRTVYRYSDDVTSSYGRGCSDAS